MTQTKEFTDQEFSAACRELDEPNVKSFELFVDSHDVKIYRQYDQESGLYRYKIYGMLNGVTPDTCSRVYMDLEYRKQWDSYVHTLTDFSDDDQRGIYWQVNFPFPLANRDYTYVRELRKTAHGDREAFVILARSRKFPSYPESSGVVRVSDYQQSLAITAADDDSQSSKAFMNYYDNPGGMIPTWIINWAASKGVPSFLTQMHDACHGYEEYCKGLSAAND